MSDRPSDLEFKLQRIVIAVQDVAEWFNLGLQLGLPSATLRLIAADPNIKDIESQRLAMLSEWLKRDTAARWEKLAVALTMIGENMVADNIRSQFMKNLSLAADDADSNQDGVDKIGPSDLEFKLQHLVFAVKNLIAEWYDLGLQLGLPDYTLRPIGSNPDIEGRLRMMLSKWLDYDPEASWEKLANALNTMGKNVIAANIRSKYLRAATTLVADRPSYLEFKFQHVVIAVQDVAKWFDLGLQLGLPSATLRLIAADPNIKDIKSQQLAMLSEWLKRDTAAGWEKLAVALTMIGENVVADNIRSQLMKNLPPAANVAESNEDKIASHLPEIVEYASITTGEAKNTSAGAAQFISVKLPANTANSTSRLTLDDVRTVLNVTWPARSKWYLIGINLGIDYGTLETIKSNHRADTDSCFTELLTTWLKSRDPTPTWKALADALRSDIIGIQVKEVSQASISTVPHLSPPTPCIGTEATSSASALTAIVEHSSVSSEVNGESSKPSSFNLTVIRWKNERAETMKFKLKSSIIHKWRDIGNLVVPRQQLEVWAKRKDDKECCEAVLSHWLDHPPRHYPATWEGLYELLDDSELGQVATELKQAVNNAI